MAKERLHFSGHLHYPLRESWIVKGLQALAEAEHQGNTARLFAHPEATDRLGLGPTMIQALRFWLRATGIMVETAGSGARRIPTLTPLGRLLHEADPSLEQLGSVWLLHAHLARCLDLAPTFTWFFQHFTNAIPFTKLGCVEMCYSWAIREAPSQEIVKKAVAFDVECLVQMYLPRPQHLSPEQQLTASPFHRLGLLTTAPLPEQEQRGVEKLYRVCPSQSENLPALVVLAILLEHAGKRLPLRHILYEPGHIGRTLSLSRDGLIEAFTSVRAFVPDWCPTIEHLGWQDWVSVPTVPVDQVLHSYYARRT